MIWSSCYLGQGCLFHGNNLSNVKGRAEDCGPKCKSTPNCTHFVWIPKNGGTCYLKKGSVSKNDALASRDPSTVCGVVPRGKKLSIDWNGNDWAPGCNFCGNDLSNVEIRAQDCGPRCVSTPNCTHFVWTTKNDGTCYLKKGHVSKSDAVRIADRNTVCGVLPNIENRTVNWGENDWAPGCNFLGNDLSSAEIRAQDCGLKCGSTPNCTHFVWTTENDGTCYLKKGPISKDNALATRDQSMVCGVVPRDENLLVNWYGNDWAHACDFAGNDLSSAEIRAEDCGSTCASTEECTHFVWTTKNNGTCYLKKGRVSKSDARGTTDVTTVCGVIPSQ